MKFRFIAVEKAHHSLSLLCRCLRVTRSGLYAWRERPESARSKRDRHLKVLVHTSFAASKGRYGSPRIHRDLREDHQEPISRKRVIRLMAGGEVASPRPQAVQVPHAWRKDPSRRPQNAEELWQVSLECTAAETWSHAAARQWWKTHLSELTHPATLAMPVAGLAVPAHIG